MTADEPEGVGLAATQVESDRRSFSKKGISVSPNGHWCYGLHPVWVAHRTVDDEQIAAVIDAVLAVERYYGCRSAWVLDKYRRADEPVCVVQARPVTLTSADTDPRPATWDPVAMATKYGFNAGPTDGQLSRTRWLWARSTW